MPNANPETRNDWIERIGEKEALLGFVVRDLTRAAAATNFFILVSGLMLAQSWRSAFLSVGDFVRVIFASGIFGAAVYARVKLSDAHWNTLGFSNSLRVLPNTPVGSPGRLLTLELRERVALG